MFINTGKLYFRIVTAADDYNPCADIAHLYSSQLSFLAQTCNINIPERSLLLNITRANSEQQRLCDPRRHGTDVVQLASQVKRRCGRKKISNVDANDELRVSARRDEESESAARIHLSGQFVGYRLHLRPNQKCQITRGLAPKITACCGRSNRISLRKGWVLEPRDLLQQRKYADR